MLSVLLGVHNTKVSARRELTVSGCVGNMFENKNTCSFQGLKIYILLADNTKYVHANWISPSGHIVYNSHFVAHFVYDKHYSRSCC